MPDRVDEGGGDGTMTLTEKEYLDKLYAGVKARERRSHRRDAVINTALAASLVVYVIFSVHACRQSSAKTVACKAKGGVVVDNECVRVERIP